MNTVNTVTIEDPGRMNVLGLFLANGLKRNLEERGRACKLEGAVTIDADGMRASVVFAGGSATVTRAETKARVVLSAPLQRLVNALVRPGLGAYLKVKVRGNPFFALRALRFFAP